MPNRPSRETSPHRVSAGRLAALVRERRAAQGLSQQDLAVAAGVSIGTIRAIEQTRTIDSSFFTIIDVLEVLNVDVSEAVEAVRAARRDPDSVRP